MSIFLFLSVYIYLRVLKVLISRLHSSLLASDVHISLLYFTTSLTSTFCNLKYTLMDIKVSVNHYT